MQRLILTAAAATLLSTVPLLAQDTYEPVCEQKGANGMVAMLLCPAGLDHAALSQEGKAYCGETKPCGAWIWDDAASVPSEAPDSHDKIPGDSVRAALGIWMNEADQLVILQAEATN